MLGERSRKVTPSCGQGTALVLALRPARSRRQLAAAARFANNRARDGDRDMAPDLENDRVLGQVSVGRGTYWDDSTRFVTYHPGESIHIGRYCSIAAEATIFAGGDHRPELASTWPFDNFLRNLPNPTRTYRQTARTRRGTIIGSDVWIGQGAHVAGGVEIGHGAVVGTKAVVFSDVPAYAIVLGNPATIIRHRFSPEIIAAMIELAWWEWPAEVVRERHDWFYEPIQKFVDEFRHAGE
jgi:acetyltransferase-like isoleucine patch superfamily enzyme